WLPAILLLGAWALHALAARDGPGAAARTLPRWLGPKDQVLGLLRYGNVLAAHGDEIFVLAIAALFVATIAVRPRPRLDRQWRLPLLTELHQVLHAAEPGKRLIAIVSSTESHLFQYQSFLHFASYYEIFRGGRARYNFAETPWTPVRFRQGSEPVPLPRSWELRPHE